MGLLSFLRSNNDPVSKRFLGKWSLLKAEGDLDLGEGVTMTFASDGKLVYVIQQKDSKQIMNLDFKVDGSRLITNQPSQPREETTEFSFDADGNLVLDYGGSKAWFMHD
jgi:hypothetical protein